MGETRYIAVLTLNGVLGTGTFKHCKLDEGIWWYTADDGKRTPLYSASYKTKREALQGLLKKRQRHLKQKQASVKITKNHIAKIKEELKRTTT